MPTRLSVLLRFPQSPTWPYTFYKVWPRTSTS
jgi:hypothetical protein